MKAPTMLTLQESPVSSGERVFDDPIRAGLALAAGATLVGFKDNGQHVLFSLQDIPEGFDGQHENGTLMIQSKDAERYIAQLVKMIRSQAKLRNRAKENREKLFISGIPSKK